MFSLKRAYIGGLPKDINEKDLSERFRTFGEVTEVEVIRQANTGECRGFAYVTLKITENSWKKCMNTFNGAKWNGITLKIQEAKPDYKQRLKQEWEAQKKNNAQPLHPPSSKKRKRPKKGELVVELSKNMSLVTNSNINERKRWKRINNDGCIATIMRMRRPDGSMITIDPSKYKNNHRKIFNNVNEVKPKPFHELMLYYSNGKEAREEEIHLEEQSYRDDVSREKKKLPTSFDIPAVLSSSGNNIMITTKDEADENYENSSTKKQPENNSSNPPSLIDGLPLKKRGFEEREKAAKIAEALRRNPEEKKKGHIVFSSDDNEEKEQKESPSRKSLFDNESNEDDDNDTHSYEIEINPIFEGSSGRKLLDLQKGFHGDTRFKLTREFINDEDDQNDQYAEDEKEKPETTQLSNDHHNNNYKKNDDIISTLIEEKSKNMDILHTMFENIEIEKFQFQTNHLNNETVWKEMTHFDPDAPEEEIQKAKRVEDNNDDIEFTKPSSASLLSPPPPPPQVSKEVKIEINANLKGIFAPSTTLNVVSSFSLFGNNNEKDNGESKNSDHEMEDAIESFISIDDNSKPLFSSLDTRQTSASPRSANKSDSFTATSGPLFFFHFGDEALEKRSHFQELNTFMRTTSMEEIIKNWESTRQGLTHEFKRKHKSVSRKRRKMQRKMNQN
ncbi:8036_t:CDS:10 [Ambispora leptoticha]|uniref:8036_t:CDS:1 n=1 Tax=Ambispora leptoticha TaxID=144679 RepID=A0A9N8VBR7_9GLOM|nr:8036_t:CDS:10 [Ambispora leptoticha]